MEQCFTVSVTQLALSELKMSFFGPYAGEKTRFPLVHALLDKAVNK